MSPSFFKELDLKLPTDYSNDELQKKIGKSLHVKNFNYEILKQSLDARKKPNVFWQARIRVFSEEFKGGQPNKPEPGLEVSFKKRSSKVIVVGSGPAGFFAAFVLQKAGFEILLVEKGPRVNQRFNDILGFENGGVDFNDNSN